jgi:hypothetical protein
MPRKNCIPFLMGGGSPVKDAFRDPGVAPVKSRPYLFRLSRIFTNDALRRSANVSPVRD